MEIKSVHAIILKGQNVLLVKRRDVPVWVLPGGGIDANESQEQAIVREVLEETGLTCIYCEKRATFIAKTAFCKNSSIFICKTNGTLKTKTKETLDAKFFNIKALNTIAIPPPYKEFITEALNTKKFVTKHITSVNAWLIFKTILIHPILVFRFFLSRLNLHINS